MEMIRYQTLEGKIEKITVSGKEQQVKDTKKERPLECHSGYIIELHIPRFDVSLDTEFYIAYVFMP